MAGSAGVKAFQDKMNITLTGSESTLSNSGLGFITDPAKAAIARIPETKEKMQAAESQAMTSVAGIQDFQDKVNVAATGSASTLSNSGLGFVTDPYREARSAELARKEAARESTGEGDDEKTLEEILEELKKQNEKVDEEIGAINGLADTGSPNSPANLRWNKMGAEDFFGVMRAGL
jgi:hypothetical protein